MRKSLKVAKCLYEEIVLEEKLFQHLGDEMLHASKTLSRLFTCLRFEAMVMASRMANGRT